MFLYLSKLLCHFILVVEMRTMLVIGIGVLVSAFYRVGTSEKTPGFINSLDDVTLLKKQLVWGIE